MLKIFFPQWDFKHFQKLWSMLLHSQQVHILHHLLTPLFLRPFTGCHHTQHTPSALFTSPNLLCLNLTERLSTPHIISTSLLHLLSCHLTPAMYLSILWSHLYRASISLLVHVHVSAAYSRANFTQASNTFPLVLSPMLWFTNKLAISRHLLHAAVTLSLSVIYNLLYATKKIHSSKLWTVPVMKLQSLDTRGWDSTTHQ